jgi:phosphoribosylanthranilate isomerase
MPVKTKICGLSTPETVSAALAGGAAYLGFMFFDKSPRKVTPEAARRLAAPARGKALTVAVMVDPDDAFVGRVVEALDPDLLQLHGAETPRRCHEIAARSGKPLIKALGVATASDLDAAAAYDDVVQHLLFDAKPPPDAERPGGLGAAIDWSLLAGRRFSRPWFLAGGLNPWNLEEAVRDSGAKMADVSSGVERGAGLKDPALIAAFLEAAARL